MPTENERKYVLNLKCESNFLNCQIKIKKYFLHQGYLAFSKGTTLRLRSSQEYNHKNFDFGEFEENPQPDIKRKLCFKQKVNGRVIEIEKKIDERDFNDLWNNCLNKVQKDRYVYEISSVRWDVDFFKHNNQTYFAMAECEMPEGMIEPEFIPDIISRNVLYTVPLDDPQFSTKRLACVVHAKKMYKKLKNAKKENLLKIKR
jgi:CYTH domain-containing protein